MDNQHTPSTDRFWSLLAKKLANEATAEEILELNSFYINHPEHIYQTDLFSAMWQQQNRQTDNTESERAFMRHLLQHKDEFFNDEIQEADILTDVTNNREKNFFHRVFTSRKSMTAGLAAIVLIIAIVIYRVTPANHTSQAAISSVITKNGNRTKIVLPDGSQVWLNAGSNLEYNNAVFNKEFREVILNGEAFFDVTKNAGKPFIIHTKKMDIKVIGTAFNVRAYSDEKITEAALIRGSIEVTLKDRKNQKIILKPNEKISIANEEEAIPVSKSGVPSVTKNSTVSLPQIVVKELKLNPVYNIVGEIAWTQNKLLFEDETLENIAPMIERWFGKKVVIENESLKNNRYYGNFENESMEVVLSSLKLSKPFNYRIDHDTVVIY